MKTSTKIVVGFVATLALWLGATYASFVVARHVSDTARVGAAGDIFGASSALFAGLGFFGLIVVLIYDLKDRKESRKPYLIPQLDAKPGNITSATTDGTHVSLIVTLEIVLKNLTAEPALNVSMDVAESKGSPKWQTDPSIDSFPFAGSDTRKHSIQLSASSEDGRKLLGLMGTGSSLTLDMAINYSNLNGAQFSSTMKLDILVKEASDRVRLQEISNGETAKNVLGQSAPGIASTTDYVELVLRMKPGSWGHRATS